jgi:hypothetical protein
MKRTLFTFCILSMVLIGIVGCTVPKPASNPLAGWKFCHSNNPVRSNERIKADYQDYIQKLPPEKRSFISGILFFEQGTGQHAVQIERGVNGTYWYHVLIYDEDNKRVKVYKYSNGGYRS